MTSCSLDKSVSSVLPIHINLSMWQSTVVQAGCHTRRHQQRWLRQTYREEYETTYKLSGVAQHPPFPRICTQALSCLPKQFFRCTFYAWVVFGQLICGKNYRQSRGKGKKQTRRQQKHGHKNQFQAGNNLTALAPIYAIK